MSNPNLSPIKNECSILSTNLLYNSNHVLNVQNKTTHNNYYDSPHILSVALEISGINILNNSQQKFYNQNNLNGEQSQISKDPRYNGIKSDNSQLDMSNLSDTWSKKSFSNETEYSNNTTSVYFDNSKKIKHKETKFKNESIPNQKNSSSVLKQSLSEKLSKTVQNNSRIKKPILNISNIKIPKLENSKCETKESHSKASISEPQIWKEQTFSDMSFSDLDKTTQSPITIKMLYSPNNKIEHDSIRLEFNDTWEKNMNNMDIELQDYSNGESLSSLNSSTQVPNLPDHDINNESNEYSISQMSSITFSSDSIEFTSNSHQLDSIKPAVKKLPQNSFDSNNYEENNIVQTANNVNTLFNNIQFEEMSYSISPENLTMVSSTYLPTLYNNYCILSGCYINDF